MLNDEITRLEKAKSDLKTAIEEKGVPVDITDKLETFAEKIKAIETGGGGVTSGSFVSLDASSVKAITHNLGVKPRFFIFWGEVENPTGSNNTSTMYRKGKQYTTEDMTSLYNSNHAYITSAFGIIHNDQFYGCSSYFVYKDEPFNSGFFHYVLNETELVMNEGSYGIFPNNPSGLCTTYWVAIA